MLFKATCDRGFSKLNVLFLEMKIILEFLHSKIETFIEITLAI